MAIQTRFTEKERTDSMKDMFIHCTDVLLDCLNELEPDEMRDIYASRLAEAERGRDQQHVSEKYESLVQKWHILHMIFSIDCPEL